MLGPAGARDLQVRPVLLSGGSGTRLWPLSRTELPKQFLPLLSERSLFDETLARVSDRTLFLPPLIVCGEAHQAHVEEALARMGIADATMVVEPVARNTAPAIAVAALAAPEVEFQLVVPCDHHIADNAAFVATVRSGLAAAADRALVTFGVEPRRPETGYGYIAAAGGSGVRPVDRFVEKPDIASAERMVTEGGHFWNAGIFLWRTDALIAELETWAPDVLSAARASLENAQAYEGIVRPTRSHFSRSPSISIDYAVMEKTALAMVVPAAMGWSDVGDWAALHELAETDRSGNVLDVGSIAIDSEGCYIRSTGPKVVAVGLQDLIIVITNEVALILPRSETQRVKEVAALVEGNKSIEQSINCETSRACDERSYAH